MHADNTQRAELDNLFSLTYDELRRLAAIIKHGDPAVTLNPTALVNEAWLKLAKSPHVATASRVHFKRIAARAMRQVLVDAARRRNSGKRGEGAAYVTLDESRAAVACTQELIGLDAALDELAQIRPRLAMMVECRFFGGLEIAEISELLEVSEATVLRDWRAAKAWLAQALQPKPGLHRR